MSHLRQWGQHTKIVCTLGPATGTRSIIEQLIRAGMDVARLNLSHGSLPDHARLIEEVRNASLRLNSRVAVMLDLPGPKYRTGKLKAGTVLLKKGSQITLTTRDIEGDENVIPINLPTLPIDVKPGSRIFIDDGAMKLRVVEMRETEVICRVIVGGTLTPGRGVVVPGMRISSPFLSDTLRHNLAFAIEQQPDYLALSFVSNAGDIQQVKDILQQSGTEIPVISKIERSEAVKNFKEILAVSDGVMVARGDLGVELPLKEIPLIQKDIIKRCNRAGKAVITATQMLESMVNSASPTRAEVTDVANAILDGTDAIMLSAETSIGKYPVQSVNMMYEIARETENHLPYHLMLTERGQWLEHQTDELIAYNACYTAYWIKAVAIVAFTHSGSTARRVSKYRPNVPIIAITPFERIAGRMGLYWGVRAFQVPNPSTVDDLFKTGAETARKLGVARPGDLIVITGGIPMGMAGTTNMLKVQKIE